MRNTVTIGLSALFMGLAFTATLSNDSVAGKAVGQVEVITTQTPSQAPETTSPSLSETPVVEETATPVPTPEKSVEAPAPIPLPTQTSQPQEDEAGWDCRLSGNRVCGVPDEAGTIHLVCHDINGMPVRIITNARNCN